MIPRGTGRVRPAPLAAVRLILLGSWAGQGGAGAPLGGRGALGHCGHPQGAGAPRPPPRRSQAFAPLSPCAHSWGTPDRAAPALLGSPRPRSPSTPLPFPQRSPSTPLPLSAQLPSRAPISKGGGASVNITNVIKLIYDCY